MLSESGDRFSARLARQIEEDVLAAEFHYQVRVVGSVPLAGTTARRSLSGTETEGPSSASTRVL